MREILRRHGWTRADTDDNGRETYFPPDGLPASAGIVSHPSSCGAKWESGAGAAGSPRWC
jgi:hypothetical protein